MPAASGRTGMPSHARTCTGGQQQWGVGGEPLGNATGGQQLDS